MKVDLNPFRKKKKEAVSVSIDKDTLHTAKRLCKEEDITFSKLVEVLLKNFLNEPAKDK